MGPAVFFSVVLCLIQSSTQYSLGGQLDSDGMVSDGVWSDGMVSDGVWSDGMVSDGVWSDDMVSAGGWSDGMVSGGGWSDDMVKEERQGAPRGCGGKPADIYLVLDTADDVSPEALASQRTYLQTLVPVFPENSPHVRVGVVTFGFIPLLSTPLGEAPTLTLLRQAVQDTPRVGGGRHTAQALKYLRETAFASPVARADAAHVVILLTDGYSADAKQTAHEASLLRQQGVIIYAVSINPFGSGHVDKGELLEVGSKPYGEFVFSAEGLDIVGSLMEVLYLHECSYQVLPPESGEGPVCVSRRPTELAFAVEHLGLGSPRTQKIITFIQELLAEVDPESPMKAAILTSKDPVARYAFSKPVNTIPLLEKKLGGLVFPNLSQLLRRAGKALSRDHPKEKQPIQKTPKQNQGDLGLSTPKKSSLRNSRSWSLGSLSRWRRSGFALKKSHKFSSSQDVQKVLVVFVDDSVQLGKKALAAARNNRRHKVDTYVVYVGPGSGEKAQGKSRGGEEEEGLDMEEVEKLASGMDHVIKIPGYRQLQYRETVVDTLRTVCRGL